MKKFIAFFCIPSATIEEWMKGTDGATRKEQTDKMMADWNTWMSDHKDAIVDQGLPIGKTKRVTASGVADAKNELTYYITVQADSHEAAAEMFKDNPQVKLIPNAYIDVCSANGPEGM